MSSFLEQLHRAKAEAAERDADPLREKVEALVRGMEAISTLAFSICSACRRRLATAAGSLRRCARWDLSRSKAAASCRAATVTP